MGTFAVAGVFKELLCNILFHLSGPNVKIILHISQLTIDVESLGHGQTIEFTQQHRSIGLTSTVHHCIQVVATHYNLFSEALIK